MQDKASCLSKWLCDPKRAYAAHIRRLVEKSHRSYGLITLAAVSISQTISYIFVIEPTASFSFIL